MASAEGADAPTAGSATVAKDALPPLRYECFSSELQLPDIRGGPSSIAFLALLVSLYSSSPLWQRNAVTLIHRQSYWSHFSETAGIDPSPGARSLNPR